jgi:3'(2'), 5'-bisphosphate nucleotidase
MAAFSAARPLANPIEPMRSAAVNLDAENTQQRLIDSVLRIAAAAGEAIMRVYGGAFDVEHKDDDSPLTQADRDSHAIITDGLASLDVSLPVLSEESPAEDVAGRRAWSHYWLVDPLDGTKEFVKRNGEFTVNIALIAAGRPILGVVDAPALGIGYAGAAALGAWRYDGTGQAHEIHTTTSGEGPARVLGSRSHPSPALATFLERIGPHEIIPMGSSLKICLVAEGRADVYPRFGPTSEWDTAAAQAVLECAGGCMIDVAGRMLRYNTKDSLLNPHFLAIGDTSRDWLAAIPSET